MERPVTEVMIDANNIGPKGVVPGNKPYSDNMFSTQAICPLNIIDLATEI